MSHFTHTTISSITDTLHQGMNIPWSSKRMVSTVAMIAKATNAFGHLRKFTFTNHCLSVNVKRAVYKAVVLATLLIGLECWAVKAGQIRHLEVFHHHCVRSILSATRHRQWTECTSHDMLLREFRMIDGLKSILIQRHMRWLGHNYM